MTLNHCCMTSYHVTLPLILAFKMTFRMAFRGYLRRTSKGSLRFTCLHIIQSLEGAIRLLLNSINVMLLKIPLEALIRESIRGFEVKACTILDIPDWQNVKNLAQPSKKRKKSVKLFMHWCFFKASLYYTLYIYVFQKLCSFWHKIFDFDFKKNCLTKKSYRKNLNVHRIVNIIHIKGSLH